MKRTLLVPIGVAIVAWIGLSASPAAAHITDDKEEVVAGGFDAITLTVPHGCEESPTTRLSIQIPEGFTSIGPQVHPGWEISTEQAGEEVSVVTFTGGPLPPHYRDTFTIGFQAPDTPGEMAYWKVIQTCEVGETGWVDEWDGEGEEPEHPAPAFMLVEGDAGHGGGAEEEELEASEGETAAAADGGGDADDGSNTTLSIIALVAGLAGLALGGFALMTARRRA
jgi:uncharacterized protein YcnI